MIILIQSSFHYIKGSLCSFGEEIQTVKGNFYNINKVIIQAQKYIFAFL